MLSWVRPRHAVTEDLLFELANLDSKVFGFVGDRDAAGAEDLLAEDFGELSGEGGVLASEAFSAVAKVGKVGEQRSLADRCRGRGGGGASARAMISARRSW